MILGEVRGGFFKELVLHSQLARLTFQLPQPFPLIDTQGRLIPGVIPAISRDPIPQRPFTNPELTSDLSDRTRRLDHQLHGLFPKLGRELPLRACQHLPSPDRPILLWFPCPENPRHFRVTSLRHPRRRSPWGFVSVDRHKPIPH